MIFEIRTGTFINVCNVTEFIVDDNTITFHYVSNKSATIKFATTGTAMQKAKELRDVFNLNGHIQFG